MVEHIRADSSARSPPTKCQLPMGAQGGLQVLQSGVGAAKMCCCLLSCWARESLGQVFECTWWSEGHCQSRGAQGYLCALPPGAQAAGFGSSALFPSPNNHRVGSGWTLLIFFPLPPPPLFFPIPAQHSQRFQQGAVECLSLPPGPT